MEDEIISFFGIVEREVQKMEYGTMTVTVLLNKGIPVSKTTNIVISKRKRYKIDKPSDKPQETSNI